MWWVGLTNILGRMPLQGRHNGRSGGMNHEDVPITVDRKFSCSCVWRVGRIFYFTDWITNAIATDSNNHDWHSLIKEKKRLQKIIKKWRCDPVYAEKTKDYRYISEIKTYPWSLMLRLVSLKERPATRNSPQHRPTLPSVPRSLPIGHHFNRLQLCLLCMVDAPD